MTPAERKALLEKARALVAEAEAEDQPVVIVPPPSVATQAAVATPLKPVPNAVPTVKDIAAVTASAPQPLPAAATGPGGDTRSSGQPSLLDTMKNVWAAMKAASTPNTNKKAS